VGEKLGQRVRGRDANTDGAMGKVEMSQVGVGSASTRSWLWTWVMRGVPARGGMFRAEMEVSASAWAFPSSAILHQMSWAGALSKG